MIVFKATAMSYLALTKPYTPMEGLPRYGLCVPVADVPDEIASAIPLTMEKAKSSDKGVLGMWGRQPLTMHTFRDGNRDMQRLLDYCTWTGTRLETLLRGEPCYIAGEIVEFNVARHPPLALPFDDVKFVPKAIRFDAFAIKLPTWDDLVGDDLL